MSGFAGIIDRSGNPVDHASLEKMKKQCDRHGRDASGIAKHASFGFAHSLLASTPQSTHEKQPLCRDGELWIVGDVRVDAREDLVAELTKAGQRAHDGLPDIDLVLHAYVAWGENCVHRLLGDFAFAIWNEPTQTLFCARDHFGVKPLYYAQDKSFFLFSNDLDAVRSHPCVSDELNDDAICDYFTFGYNLNERTTSFGQVLRLPPGHLLVMKPGGGPKLRKYREIDVSTRLRYSDTRDYADHFLDLFSKAVGDRLRSDKVCFELSGGLDSTSVAAMAAGLNTENEHFSGLGISTDGSSRSSEDREAAYARLVADQWRLQHVTIEAGRAEDLYRYCDTAQPYAWPFAATTKTFARKARAHGKVLLGGQFGDVLMQGSGSRLRDEFRERSLADFAKERFRAVFQKRSLRALGIRTLAGRHRPNIPLPPIPEWIRQDALKRSRSEKRWKELFYARSRFPRTCQAERAFDELRMPFWSHLFESYYHDLLCGIDCRHPFLDLRLVEFAFSVPASVKVNKQLIRVAMAQTLPEPVASRDKTPVAQDIVQAALSDPAAYEEHKRELTVSKAWIRDHAYRAALERYASGQIEDPFTILCPLSFEHWYRHRLVLR
jgi:asparagine synthase (glutamine-hydrolysing)